MRTLHMPPEEHDRHLADVSHLPHVVAAALVAMQEERALALCGKGFLDATRIAGGDGELWRDILLDNADQVRAGLARLKSALGELEGMLERHEGQKLAAWLSAAAHRREALVQRKLQELNPD
jgi:prephenate dehydrogenase